MERRKESSNIVIVSDRKKQEPNDTPELDDGSKQSKQRKESQEKDAFNDVPKRKPREYRCTIQHSLLGPTIQKWTGKNQNMIHRYTHHALLQVPLQPNVLTKETIFGHFEPEKRWHVGLPTPLYIAPEMDGPTVPDLMVRFLHQKNTYSRKLRSTRIAYHHIKSKRAVNNRVGSLNDSGGMQNSAALVYAALLDRDPDPYLHSEANYDYHFTGGSCATLRTFDGRSRTTVTTVFKAIGESLAELEVMQIRCPKEELAVRRVQICNTNAAGPILEILTVGDHPAGCFVLVRKRNSIVILREQLVENKPEPISRWVPFASIVSVVPFASVCSINPTALKNRQMLILCTTDYQRVLRLWTIECSKHNQTGDVQFVKQLQLPAKHNSLLQRVDNSPEHSNTSCKDAPRGQRCSDGWSTVRCVDGGSILACLDRDMVHLYRFKSEDASPELVYCGGQDFSQWTYVCESHCALDVAPDEGLIFIATCHHLFVVRLASHEGAQSGSDPCEDAKPSLTVVIVFAHNLRQRPVFMHFLPYSFEEEAATGKEEQCFLLLASHLAMDYCICPINRQGTGKDDERPPCNMVARQYPYHPRTFFDSYKLAQRQGHCLSAQEPLKRRFFACHSGACLVPFDDCLYVILQNSCGDLLQQKMSANTSECHREDATVPEVIRRWHDQLIEEQTAHHESGHPPYKATDFRPLKRFRDIFNYPGRLSSDLVEQIFPKKIVKKGGAKSIEPMEEEGSASSVASDSDFSDFEDEVTPRSNQKPLPWQQPIEQIQQYKDVLVSPLLDVWGYGIEQGAESHHTIPTTLPPYNNVTERVDSWINTVSTARRPSTESNTSDNFNDTSNFDIESKLFTFTIATQMLQDNDRHGSHTELAEGVECKESQHPFASSTPPEEAPRTTETRPKKKTYVKGF